MEIDTLAKLIPYLQPADPHFWLVLDIDQTTIRSPHWIGSEPWFYERIEQLLGAGLPKDTAVLQANDEWELAHATIAAVPMEENTATWIASWQQNPLRLMGLTARRPEMAARTEEQLHEVGIDYSRSAPLPQDLDLDSQVGYRNGILYLGPLLSKGVVFRRFMEKMKNLPQWVLFVDDRDEHVTSMRQGLATTPIRFRGFRYALADQLRYERSS